MWEWLRNNAELISTFASIGMLGVWTLYLQLILSNYRRSRRGYILINRGAGHSIDARCIISNMSAEPIYIEAVRLSLHRHDNEYVCSLSDLDVSMSTDTDPRPQWMQGPLGSSEMIDIGAFGSLIDRAFGNSVVCAQLDEKDVREAAMLTVTVIASLTSEDGLVAARRRFRLIPSNGNLQLQPQSLRTDQVRSGRERRAIESELKRDLEKEWNGVEM